MTVFDLIHELMVFNPEAKVLTEGCDCLGEAKSPRLPNENEYMPGVSLEDRAKIKKSPDDFVVIARA